MDALDKKRAEESLVAADRIRAAERSARLEAKRSTLVGQLNKYQEQEEIQQLQSIKKSQEEDEGEDDDGKGKISVVAL